MPGLAIDSGVAISSRTSGTAFTASPSTNLTASGLTAKFTATQNQAFGDVCYIAATGKASLARADAIANAGVICMVSDATIAANATGNYLMIGFARNDSWAWTPGSYVFLSTVGTTGNTLTQTAPSGANNAIQVIGWAIHADRLFINPSLVIVEHS